eukprot:TRINITY_DN10508_c0_g1_i1.p1 TRINITY_DN10508_c0_g1~~TRINITY_DN10508_c0_g1_i1.p1  ORF type:complete len:142 (+),score=26.23 TRINITY_DN10508_c0_g1_i1:70-495(+)
MMCPKRSGLLADELLDVPILDRERFTEISQGDEEFEEELWKMGRAEILKISQDLEAVLKKPPIEYFGALLSSLVGVPANCGFMKILFVARQTRIVLGYYGPSFDIEGGLEHLALLQDLIRELPLYFHEDRCSWIIPDSWPS